MTRKTVAVIQSRMGSTRLPGKVLLPLACEHVLEHDIARVAAADTVNEVVVATSVGQQDDTIEMVVAETDASVYRGSESDVLGRIFEAADEVEADTVVRITADCPLVPPAVIDEAVTKLHRTEVEYVSNTFERSFPRGFDVEAFTFDSFERVASLADDDEEREHVTVTYRERPDEFDISSLDSTEVFDESTLQGRTDLRLTLDVAADYELLSKIYDGAEFNEILSGEDAVRYVDEHDLTTVNEHVSQKKTR